mmetsp:Transcript_35548/g.60948  ORF Transcript_35548/g.60948 Transcript_35548/m.60948 type:complete len:210 (-) Transcript_35548:99-728(-)
MRKPLSPSRRISATSYTPSLPPSPEPSLPPSLPSSERAWPSPRATFSAAASCSAASRWAWCIRPRGGVAGRRGGVACPIILTMRAAPSPPLALSLPSPPLVLSWALFSSTSATRRAQRRFARGDLSATTSARLPLATAASSGSARVSSSCRPRERLGTAGDAATSERWACLCQAARRSLMAGDARTRPLSTSAMLRRTRWMLTLPSSSR